MKRILLVVGVCVTLVPAAWAQDEAMDERSVAGTVEASAGAGVNLPVGTFSDNANTGFALGLHVGYNLNDRWAVGGEFGYYAHDASDQLKSALSDTLFERTGTRAAVDASWAMLQLTAYGKFLVLPKKKVVPYVKGQLGYYWLRGKGETSGGTSVDCSPPGCTSGTEWTGDFGLGGGAGIQFKFWEIVGAYADVLYHAVLTEGDTTQFVSLQGGIIVFLPGV